MKIRYIKRSTIIGLFLLGAANVFGQNINPTPADHKVTLNKSLYEHTYNSGGLDATREGVDTVMVTSVMDYFVMPDIFYNKTYFEQTDYKRTDLTVSRFEWTVTNGTAAAQVPNSTATSPWIKMTWGAILGSVDIKMVEKPQLTGVTCDGAEVTIPVFVIAKPTIGFNQVGTPAAYSAAGCYTDVTKVDAEYDFPITVTTSSSQILVDCSIKWTKLDNTIATTTQTNIPVSTSGTFNLEFDDYGIYEVTITKITDRIARKCEVLGDITSGRGVFAYSVLPQPKAGKTYHVPNNF